MNIQAVARRTGVPAATLRKWEQRYGVLRPGRTSGSHRRYSERDVLRVEWLKARLGEGYRIGEAARLLGAGGDGAPLDRDALADELVAATEATDAARVERVLEQAFKLSDPAEAIRDVVAPALRAVGDAWEEGRVSIGQEHQTSELVRTRLCTLAGQGAAGPRGLAVLACVAGERHELGLLTLAVLLQRAGWGIRYLGADTPLADALEVARASDATLLCVSATLDEHAREAEPELEKLTARNGFLVLRGGAAFGGVPAAEALANLGRLAPA